MNLKSTLNNTEGLNYFLVHENVYVNQDGSLAKPQTVVVVFNNELDAKAAEQALGKSKQPTFSIFLGQRGSTGKDGRGRPN